jgi:hypothetical protein
MVIKIDVRDKNFKERTRCRIIEYRKATEGEILMLILGELHGRHEMLRGIWVPTQHVLYGLRKSTEDLDRYGPSQDLPDAY